MTKTCSGCSKGTTISAAQMWCDDCENAYQTNKNCEHKNKRFYSINDEGRFRNKYHVCEDCGVKIAGKDDELESIRSNRDLLDNANIELNHKVITLTKKIEDLEYRYSYVCEICYGVGEVGFQLNDGTYENHICPCTLGVQQGIWQETIRILTEDGFQGGADLLKSIGKARGYVE